MSTDSPVSAAKASAAQTSHKGQFVPLRILGRALAPRDEHNAAHADGDDPNDFPINGESRAQLFDSGPASGSDHHSSRARHQPPPDDADASPQRKRVRGVPRTMTRDLREFEESLRIVKHECVVNLRTTVAQRDERGHPTRRSNIAASRLLSMIAHEERRLDRDDDVQWQRGVQLASDPDL